MIVAGCSGGDIRIWDTRNHHRNNTSTSSVVVRPSSSSMIQSSLFGHKGCILDVSQPICSSGYSVISGCIHGRVCFWDVRKEGVVSHIQAHTDQMSAMSVHRYSPVFATGSLRQSIKLWSLSGSMLSKIEFYDGFVGQRIGQVNTLSFHPSQMLLSVGCSDAVLSLFGTSSSN